MIGLRGIRTAARKLPSHHTDTGFRRLQFHSSAFLKHEQENESEVENRLRSVEQSAAVLQVEQKQLKDELKAKLSSEPGGLQSALYDLRANVDKLMVDRQTVKSDMASTQTQLLAKLDSLENKLTARIDSVESQLIARSDAAEHRLSTKIDAKFQDIQKLQLNMLMRAMVLVVGSGALVFGTNVSNMFRDSADESKS